MRLLLFISVVWKVYVHEVKTLTCLTCDSVVEPRHCSTVMTCPYNDVCFVERIKSFGEEVYALGCMRDQLCRNITSTSTTSRCSQCCSKDLCNQEGCGETGYPDSRGPVCYNCNEGVPEGRCHNIDICRPGEICSVSGRGMFGTTVFTSKCMQQESCEAHQGHGLDIIGKRGFMSMSLARSYDVHDCFQCCTADLCNNNCHNIVDGQWSSWGSWSACTSQCNKTRTRICNNPSPDNGGRDCHGNANQVQSCNTDQCLVSDCFMLKSLESTRPSGVYNITTTLSLSTVQVYCDMDTVGGGWTIFQRRYNGSVDFYRTFLDYENGFGNAHGEYWLGLKYIREITSSGSHQLRVDIERSNGSKGYEAHGNFSLQPGPSYTLNLVDPHFIPSISESPVDKAFSTYDHDVDRRDGGNCAASYKGGWWYDGCFVGLNLNGLYQPGVDEATSMSYDSNVGLAGSTMMFRLMNVE